MSDYKIIKDSKMEKVYEINISDSQITQNYNAEVSKIIPSVRIQGFRKGHVPAKFVEQNYGKSIRYDVFEKLVRTTISDIVKEQNYRLASQPEIDFDETNLFNGGSDIKVQITFTVFAEVSQINLSNIIVNTYKIEASEEDINESLEVFRSKNSTKVKVQRQIKQGDIVKLNCKGYINDVEFKEGEVKDYMLEIGSKSFIDNFEDQLIGKIEGEKCDVFVKFPESYHATHLAGKDAKFSVDILEVFEKQLPELTEDFLKQNTKSVNIEDFKKELKDNIEKYYNGFIRDSSKNQVFELLTESLDMDVPEKLLKNLVDGSLKTSLEDNERLNEDQRLSEAEIIEKITADSRKKIALSLYIQNLADKEKITVNEQEIFNFIIEESSRVGANPMELLKLYQESDKSGNAIKEIVKEKKVYDFIYESITKNFETISRKKMEDLIKTPDFKIIQ
jgi:trigger factor